MARTSNSQQSTGVPSNALAEMDLQRRIREQGESSFWSALSPSNWGFGSLLMLALIGGALYFFGATDKGRAMIGEFFDGLSPEWQTRLAGWGAKLGLLPEGVTGEAATALMGIGRRHGVTGLSVEDYLKPDILFDAMIEQPQTVLSMARGLPRGTGADDATTLAAMGAVRQIVANPQRLATLLSPQHKANTFALLEMLCPVPFEAGALGTFIESVGMRRQTDRAQFTEFLTTMLADDGTARNRGFGDYLKKVDASALRTLLLSADIERITDPVLRGQVEGLLQIAATTNTLRAGLAIESRLQERGTSSTALFEQMQGGVSGLVTFMLNSNNRATASPVLGSLGVLAEQKAAALAPGDPDRVFLSFLGTRQHIAGQPDQAVNLTATMKFFHRIGRNDFNRQDPVRTHSVITGMLGMLSGDADAARLITPQNVAQFFSNPGNVETFGLLLREIKDDNLPPAMRNAVRNMRAHWGNSDHGIGEVLGNQESLAWLMNPPSTRPGASVAQSIFGMLSPEWQARVAGVGASVNLVPDKIGENAGDLLAVQASLANLGVTLDHRVTAQPTARAVSGPLRQ